MLERSKRYEQGSERLAAVLEQISGPGRGSETPLFADNIVIALDDDRQITTQTARGSENSGDKTPIVAKLTRTDGTYFLECPEGREVWVNGRQFHAGQLMHRDIVEFGDKGPLVRYRLWDKRSHSRKPPGEICADCWDYLRSSRKPFPKRLALAAGDSARQLLTRTTLVFRLGVIFLFAITGVVFYQQHALNVLQQEQLADSRLRAEQIAHSLLESRQIANADLESLQKTIADRLAERDDRLSQLERSASATIDTIREASPSVVFLQGAYGLRDSGTGLGLRHIVDAEGNRRLGPGGRPLLSFDGKGPLMERQFTGTGFAVADGTVLATNRHVAVPWSANGQVLEFGDRRMQPFMIRFVAYVPGDANPAAVELIRASDDSDLALVKIIDPSRSLPPLAVATKEPAQGASVTVLGYPTGLHSMVAGAGKAFVEELRRTGKSSFWEVSARLASENRIKPLSSFGIVAQRTDSFLVYDAATTRGGSGGPVINDSGEVVAVNAAFLQQYDGSNFGVLASKLNELLRSAGVHVAARASDG